MEELDPTDLSVPMPLQPAVPIADPVEPEFTESTAGAAVAADPIAVEPEPLPEPVAEVKPTKSRYKEPVAVTLDDVQTAPEPAGPAVVGNGERDEVKLSAIVFKNELARKSLSVHHLQRRLVELGYADAHKDRDGYFGDNTRRAVARFQEQNDMQPDGHVSLPLLELVFRGDPNVDVTAE